MTGEKAWKGDLLKLIWIEDQVKGDNMTPHE